MHLAASLSALKPITLVGYTYTLVGSINGVPDGGVGALSMFAKSNDNANTSQTRGIFNTGGFNSGPLVINTNGTEFLTITLSRGASVLSAVSTSYQFLATNPEDNLVIEWDTNQVAGSKKLKAYINGTEIALTITDVSAPFTLAYSTITGSTLAYQGSYDIREFMLWLNTVPVFPAALSELRTSAGQPVNPGDLGQYLSVRPDVYLSRRGSAAAKAFAQNRGKASSTWAFGSGVAYDATKRIYGYGDSNMATGYAATYTSQLGDYTPIRMPVFNHGVANATLVQIGGYVLNGGIQGRPSIAWIKANYPDSVFVLEGGGNSLPVDGTGGVTVATLLSWWATIITNLTDALPNARFIVQGISTRVGSETGTYKRTILDGVNAGLASIHGARYFDVDNYLRSDQAFIDAGISKSAADLANLAVGITPDSFLADALVHLNATAHNLLRPRALTLMQSLGYL